MNLKFNSPTQRANDSIDDCKDNSDETSQERQCSASEFKCHHGGCISLAWLCDKQIDCEGGCFIDEFNSLKVLKEQRILKWISKTTSNQFLSFSNTPDGSDELDCDNDSVPFFNQITCPLGQYKCRNNRCISLMYRCDGANDCIDFSKFRWYLEGAM